MTSCRFGEKRGVSTRSLPSVSMRTLKPSWSMIASWRLRCCLRAGFGDEDDAGIEIALFAGDLLVDRVGDDMGDTAPVFRLRVELLAGHLLSGEGIPEAELGAQTAIGFLRDTAGDQRLSVDHLPVLEARRLRPDWRSSR